MRALAKLLIQAPCHWCRLRQDVRSLAQQLAPKLSNKWIVKVLPFLDPDVSCRLFRLAVRAGLAYTKYARLGARTMISWFKPQIRHPHLGLPSLRPGLPKDCTADHGLPGRLAAITPNAVLKLNMCPYPPPLNQVVERRFRSWDIKDCIFQVCLSEMHHQAT